jgi:hypothetical protein
MRMTKEQKERADLAKFLIFGYGSPKGTVKVRSTKEK